MWLLTFFAFLISYACALDNYCVAYTSSVFIPATFDISCGFNDYWLGLPVDHDPSCFLGDGDDSRPCDQQCICSVDYALFGLLSISDCDFGTLSVVPLCTANVSSFISSKCMGKQTCTINWPSDFSSPCQSIWFFNLIASFAAGGRCCQCPKGTHSLSHRSKSHRSKSRKSKSHSLSHKSKSHRSKSRASKSHRSKSRRSLSHRSKSHKSKSHRSKSRKSQSHKSKSHLSKSHKSRSHKSISRMSKSHKSKSISDHLKTHSISKNSKSESHRSKSHRSNSYRSKSHESLSHLSVSKMSISHSKSHSHRSNSHRSVSKMSISQSKSHMSESHQTISISEHLQTYSISKKSKSKSNNPHTHSVSYSDSFATHSKSFTTSRSKSHSGIHALSNSQSRSISRSPVPEIYHVDPTNNSVCIGVTIMKSESFNFTFSCPTSNGFFCDVGYASIGKNLQNATCTPSVSFITQDCHRNLTHYMMDKCMFEHTCSFVPADIFYSNITEPPCPAYMNATSVDFNFYGTCCSAPTTCENITNVNATQQITSVNNDTLLQLIDNVPACPYRLKANSTRFNPFVGLTLNLGVNQTAAQILLLRCFIAVFLSPSHAASIALVPSLSGNIIPQLFYNEEGDNGEYWCGRYLFPAPYIGYELIPNILNFQTACNSSIAPFLEYEVVFTNTVLYPTTSVDLTIAGLLPGDSFYISEIEITFTNYTVTKIPIAPCLNTTLVAKTCVCNAPSCASGGFKYITSPVMFDQNGTVVK